MCFVISEVFGIYGVFVIFISKIKNSHISASLASFHNFDQSGHLWWILRFHSIILNIITHTPDLAVVKSQSILQWSYNHNVQPSYHRSSVSVCDSGLLKWSFIMQQLHSSNYFCILQIICLLLLYHTNWKIILMLLFVFNREVKIFVTNLFIY